MRKGIFLFSLFIFLSVDVVAANYVPKQFANTSTGEGLYPYSLNNRRQQTKTNNNVSPIGSGVSPMRQMGKRNVVKRPVRARAASTTTQPTTNYTTTQPRRVVQRTNTVRSATTNGNNTYRATDNRSVVARGSTLTQQRARSTNARRTTTSSSSTDATSAQKCFANYKECMEMYCKREDTAYNRCYCSAKLAQIDSKYQKNIENLIQEIINLKYKTLEQNAIDNEYIDAPLSSVKDYWDETVKDYTGTNPWLELDNALNIPWADTESRVRGQNAFNTGHRYCVNYLKSCSYMASNLRDAYKSEITRDCATYEDSLRKIKNAAESVIANYDK